MNRKNLLTSVEECSFRTKSDYYSAYILTVEKIETNWHALEEAMPRNQHAYRMVTAINWEMFNYGGKWSTVRFYLMVTQFALWSLWSEVILCMIKNLYAKDSINVLSYIWPFAIKRLQLCVLILLWSYPVCFDFFSIAIFQKLHVFLQFIQKLSYNSRTWI